MVVKLKVSQVWLCNPMNYTVHGILQARIPEWVAFPFSRGSSQPRDRTQVSFIEGGFFTSWATREAQAYWSGYHFPSPADLPDPGIKPWSLALQVDSLPTELSGKPGMEGSKANWRNWPWLKVGTPFNASQSLAQGTQVPCYQVFQKFKKKPEIWILT